MRVRKRGRLHGVHRLVRGQICQVPGVAPAQPARRGQHKQRRGGIGGQFRVGGTQRQHGGKFQSRILLQCPGEALNRGIRKQGTDAHRQSQLLANSGNNLKCCQRMAPGCKEIFGGAEPFPPQHTRENSAQLLLQQPVRAARIGSGGSEPELSQLFTVRLTGGTHRQRLHRVPEGRNHVVGQVPLADPTRVSNNLFTLFRAEGAYLKERSERGLPQPRVQQRHRAGD